MSQAAYTLRWSATSQTYELSGPPGAASLSLVVDTAAWFAWLTEASSFAFHGQAGIYTARKEAAQCGDRYDRYWYAYRRTGQKLRKRYLGTTADLTLPRLEQVAERLQTEHAHDLPESGSRSAQEGPPTRPSAAAPAPFPGQKSALGRVTASPEVADAHEASPAAPASAAALPGDPFNPLIATKLHVPRVSAQLVHRTRLCARLQHSLEQPLTIISAPAGFGKTTLLAQWLSESGMPAAWLSLDAEDDDPLRFLSAFLAALQTLDPSLGASVRVLLLSRQVLQGLSLPAVFTLLINELADRETGDLLLVLDDYHVITAPAIQRAISTLVEHCPPTVHLVLATRADPPLPLARMRARGRLCELRAADLQFDAEEATSFLRSALGSGLPAETIAAISQGTEGWIAGMHLTVLSLQGRRTQAEVQRFLAESAGSHRFLVDYLVEEVLTRQSEAVQSFLLHTCILDRLSAPLCSAVIGESSPDESEAMLASLERANLFLTSLDEGRNWYRYHHLWASVLRTMLTRRLGAAGVASLYARASQWYEQHDLPAEALAAAIEAGEFARAVDLVEQLSVILIAHYQFHQLRRWIERLPAEHWAARPLVCFVYAWCLFLGGEHDAYAAPLDEAERLFRQTANEVGVGMAQALRTTAAAIWGDGRRAIAAGREALARLPAADLVLRGLTLLSIGSAYWQAGDLNAAAQALAEARTLHERADTGAGLLFNRFMVGNVLALAGRLREAADHFRQVIAEAGVRRGYAIHAMIRLALVLYEWNELEAAEAEVARAITESRETEDHVLLARGTLCLAYFTQARIRQARGEHDAARTLLAHAEGVARQSRHAQFPAQIQAARVRHWLSQGQEEAVTRWRETHDHRAADATPIFEDEPGALVLARVLIAEGEPAQAQRQLDSFLTLARSQGRLGSELEILVLSALAAHAQGQTDVAARTLEQALGLGEPAGYVRLFVDEGAPLAALLRLARSRRSVRRGTGYIDKLLATIAAEHPEPAADRPAAHAPDQTAALREPLSGREREVLRLLAEGRSYPEIADELVISLNTVKTQVASLYRKLDVHKRQDAIAAADRLYLL